MPVYEMPYPNCPRTLGEALTDLEEQFAARLAERDDPELEQLYERLLAAKLRLEFTLDKVERFLDNRTDGAPDSNWFSKECGRLGTMLRYVRGLP